MKEIEKGLPNNGCGNTPQSILSNKLEHEKCWDKYAKNNVVALPFF